MTHQSCVAHPALAALATGLSLFAMLGGSGCERRPPSGERSPAHAPVPARDFQRHFTDITQSSGIHFRHVTGGYGEKLLPETLGAGAAFLDYDGDGILDIFFVNSCAWPGHVPPGSPPARCALYRGRGDGTFTDVTEATGAGISLYGMGCTVADYDGDGDPDIYITAVGDNVLLRNDGGVFHDETKAAGVAGGRWRDPGRQDGDGHPEWSTAAAWLDIDNDGDLDLFVTNYVAWTPNDEIFTTLDGVHKAFTTPDRYRGLPCRLYLNRGDGTFEDATKKAGLLPIEGKSLGIALWDFDGNGLTDLVVANDTRPNLLFFNRGGGRLEEQGLECGIAYDATGRARAGMGIDVADFRNDGVPAVAIGNFSEEPMSLYLWRKDGTFSPEAAAAGLAAPTFRPLAFAVRFLDLDLDGIQDLLVVNGHIEPDIRRMFPDQSHAQSPQIFQGIPGGRFVDVSAAAGPDFVRPLVGRGLAAGDIDGDGDLDLLLTSNGGPPRLLRNDAAPGAPKHHFLRVQLRGRGMNRDALGARVLLKAGGITQARMVRTGSSYLSQSETTLTFGLGARTAVDELHITWPDGKQTSHAVTDVDRTIMIEER